MRLWAVEGRAGHRGVRFGCYVNEWNVHHAFSNMFPGHYLCFVTTIRGVTGNPLKCFDIYIQSTIQRVIFTLYIHLCARIIVVYIANCLILRICRCLSDFFPRSRGDIVIKY